MTNKETKLIEAYSLFEFCQKAQEAILQGFVFDLESNDNAPTAFGSLLIAMMVKETKSELPQQDPSEFISKRKKI